MVEAISIRAIVNSDASVLIKVTSQTFELDPGRCYPYQYHRLPASSDDRSDRGASKCHLRIVVPELIRLEPKLDLSATQC